jgi:hypothetical protein
MSLRQQILQLFTDNEPVSIHTLYNRFPDQKQTTLRGRLYECLGKSVTRIGKGLYISSTAIVETGDARVLIDNLVHDGDKFDFIFLDIPYKAAGQKGGNKNLFNLDTISPEDFTELLPKCESLLRTEDSFICFMFTAGKTSAPAFKKYYKAFSHTNLKLAGQGSYEKLWKNGNPMNMGKYKMPDEFILLFNKSGNFDKWKDLSLRFSLSPNFDYPTAKPYPMIHSLVNTFTNKFQWILDLFVGSGVIVDVCRDLKRFCHVIDSSEESIENFVLPKLKIEI